MLYWFYAIVTLFLRSLFHSIFYFFKFTIFFLFGFHLYFQCSYYFILWTLQIFYPFFFINECESCQPYWLLSTVPQRHIYIHMSLCSCVKILTRSQLVPVFLLVLALKVSYLGKPLVLSKPGQFVTLYLLYN